MTCIQEGFFFPFGLKRERGRGETFFVSLVPSVIPSSSQGVLICTTLLWYTSAKVELSYINMCVCIIVRSLRIIKLFMIFEKILINVSKVL